MDGIAENWATLSNVSLLEQTMGATERITKLIESLPERDVAEILDFAEFLATRHQNESRTTAAPTSFLDAVEGLEIDAPADYSTRFADRLYDHRA